MSERLTGIKTRLADGPLELWSGHRVEGAPNLREEDADWLVEQAELARELGDLLPQKINEIERLRGLLARLEWPETLPGSGAWHICPVCSNHRVEGHDPDCWLAAELGR